MIDIRLYLMFHCICILWMFYVFIRCDYNPTPYELALIVIFAPMIVVGSWLAKIFSDERRDK